MNKFFKNLILSILFLLILQNTVLAREMKIVQFSDIHLETQKPDKKVRKFAQSVPMLRKAIFKTNILGPNIVVFSGDMINRPVESEFDVFLKYAKNIKTHYYTTMGNHDIGVGGGLSKEIMMKKLKENCSWYDTEKPYYYVIKDDYIFIFMDGSNDSKITAMGTFSKESMNFLDKTLTDNATKKAVIIQHFPLLTPFKSASHEVTNKAEYLSMLDRHPNVILVLAGHYHASKAIVKNNILHVTTPSMIEYPHSFRYLTINATNDNIVIQSEMFPDIEQNSYENAALPINKLKLGLNGDNFFTITLKNNVEKPKATTFFEKFKIQK